MLRLAESPQGPGCVVKGAIIAYSWQESIVPAGTQDIQCDIEYLDKSYIHVYLDGAETNAFTWTSSTNIRLNSPLSAETVVLLIRKTEREYLYIEFASGAPFIEGNVDTQNMQLLHLAQELVEGRYIEGFYGDINMHRYRITNLGDPVTARDAANKQYVDAGDARLDQRIDAEHAAWVAAVDNEASIRKAADDSLDVRTTNLEQTYFNANTNSFPWWTITTTGTNTIIPGMPFTQAKVRLNGVTQTAGYSYSVDNGVITFAKTIPAGVLVDVTIGIDTEADTSAVSSVLGILAGAQGSSYIGGLGYVTPQMFGAVSGSNTADNTDAVLNAISAAAASNRILVLSGGPFRVTKTLDLTSVRHVVADYTGRILVDPSNFTPKHSRAFVITMGNPDTPFGSGRCNHITVSGYLSIDATRGPTVLGGVYVKGGLMKLGALRIRGFNGNGFRADAWWDSVVDSISIELCGNTSMYALDINPYGDTSNTLNIGRLQVEQAYHKQMNIKAIRSNIGPIHAERLKILTLDDGTTGLPGDVSYRNTDIDLTNSTMDQMILDAATDTGAGTVTTTPSVRLNLYESHASSLYLGTSVVVASAGKHGKMDSCSFYKYYNPSYSVTMSSCRVTRAAGDGYLKVGGDGFVAQNCLVDTFQPDYGTTSAMFISCTFNNDYSNIAAGVAGILFDRCKFAGSITSTGPTAVAVPTEFRDCIIGGAFVGSFQHRVVVRGGYIATVNLASRAYAEFYNVRGGTFNYIGDRAFITNGCNFTTVTAWGPPSFGVYPIGCRTQRMGAMASGTVVEYINTADAGATFSAAITLP